MANKNIKILYVLNKCPYPLFDGTRERIFGEIKFLSQEYMLDVLITSTEKVTEDQLKHLKEITSGKVYLFKISIINAFINSLFGLFSKKPIQVSYFWYSKAKHWLATNANKYQSIYFHTIRNGKYIDMLKKEHLCENTKLFLSFNDAISLNYARAKEKATGIWKLIYTLEESRVKNYEIFMLGIADGFSIVSIEDKNHILTNWQEKFPKEQKPTIQLIRNGIKDEYLKFTYTGENKNLVFFGNLLYPPNRQGLESFMRDIWPRILEKKPETKIIIIGRGGEIFKNVRNAEVMGFVEAPYETMCKQSALINPINFGAGVPTKVLLGMAIGIPVISYNAGIAGIENIENNKNIILIEPNDITGSVEIICNILNNSNTRNEVSRNGRDLIIEKYLASKNYPDLGLLLTEKSTNS